MESKSVHIDTLPYSPPVEEPGLLSPRVSEDLLALPVYRSTATAEERQLSLAKVRGQLSDLSTQIGYETLAVSCGRCGHRVSVVRAYRCLYCGVWFCRTCAQLHFGMRVSSGD
jgi:hypothetical protein